MTETYHLEYENVQITFRHNVIHTMCASYRTSSPADFAIKITHADIEYERVLATQPGYSDTYLETLAVYRKIAERMPDYDTFLFHGSCVSVDGQGYVFTAKSGTGKSTHTRLWRELLGDRAVMVNDDKPLVRVNEDGSAVAYGTPWDGKHRLSNNIAVPLKSICILERAADNSIREITKVEALPMLIQQAYRPSDPVALSKTLALIDRLDVKLYRLSCNMDISVAALSYETMKG